MTTSATATEAPESMTLGSTTIAAIEAAWAAIVERHPEVPARIVIITGQGASGTSIKRGHWAPGRWIDSGAGERIAEVFIAGERIADGSCGVLNTLIHEAVHALAHARGIKDTSRQNRYHNGRFAELAREMGLVPPESPDATLGFSDATLPDETAEEYAEVLAGLDAALGVSMPLVTMETLIAYAALSAFMLDAMGFLGQWRSWQELFGVRSATALAAGSGARLMKPKAPRVARPKVTLRCECKSVTVEPAVAEALGNVTCCECGHAMAHEEG